MAAETVYLFVFTTMADWEPSFAIAGINHPASSASPAATVATVGLNTETVTTMAACIQPTRPSTPFPARQPC